MNPVRQELLRRLQRLSDLAPDLRFGKLLANLTFHAAGPWDQTLWDVEDEQLLAALQHQLADLEARLEAAATAQPQEGIQEVAGAPR